MSGTSTTRRTGWCGGSRRPADAAVPDYLLYALIVGCEAAFWLVLLLALVARYLLKRERQSRVLLYALPGIDLLLLTFTTVDLAGGTPATFAHGLAAAYVGFTLMFGSLAVKWADQRFAYWAKAGPPPEKAPSRGWAAVRYEFDLWFRSIAAWVITLILVVALIAYIDNEAITAKLNDWFRFAFGSMVLWFVFGPLWSLVFFRREEKQEAA